MQISNYFFSVIIPVYNSELFLKKAVSSILQEKIKDIEIILVNDRSDDRSLQPSHGRIRKWRCDICWKKIW